MYPRRKNSLVPDFRRMAALPTALGLGFLTDPVPGTSCRAWFCTFAVHLRKDPVPGRRFPEYIPEEVMVSSDICFLDEAFQKASVQVPQNSLAMEGWTGWN